MFRATVMCGHTAYDWNTMPMPRRSGGTATPAAVSLSARPARSMRPALGISSPAIMRSVVVLPHPDGPSSVINSPFSISRSRLRTAWKSPNRFSIALRTMWLIAASARQRAP